MTFYRYYTDKEALILDILQQKEREFMQALLDITADKSSAREKLFAVFEYYNNWFTCEDFHGCMFTRALFEYGAHLPLSGRFVRSLNRAYTSFSATSSSRY
jgi:AcrR family transcriptional regulator